MWFKGIASIFSISSWKGKTFYFYTLIQIKAIVTRVNISVTKCHRLYIIGLNGQQDSISLKVFLLTNPMQKSYIVKISHEKDEIETNKFFWLRFGLANAINDH